MNEFPRTTVGGVSLSRMLIGTNWLLGWSHTSASADEMIRRRYDSAEAFKPVLEAYLRHGVDTIMAPFGASPQLVEAIRDTEQKLGRGIILVDTPTLNVDDNPQARQEGGQTVKEVRQAGRQVLPAAPLLRRAAGGQEQRRHPPAGRLHQDDPGRGDDSRPVRPHAGADRLFRRERLRRGDLHSDFQLHGLFDAGGD